MTKFKNNRGFAMMSVMMAVSISLMMVGGVVVTATHAQKLATEDTARHQLQVIESRVYDTVYVVNGSYHALGTEGGTSVEQLLKIEVFPKEMIKSSGTTPVVMNPWKGSVDVFEDNAVLTRFYVVFGEVPKSACISLGTKLTNVHVGSITGANLTSAAVAMDQCQDSNRMYFQIGRV